MPNAVDAVYAINFEHSDQVIAAGAWTQAACVGLTVYAKYSLLIHTQYSHAPKHIIITRLQYTYGI